ncbi:MAG: carbohydrate ABC transporter permease [Beutenbergiaceae bacterium]
MKLGRGAQARLGLALVALPVLICLGFILFPLVVAVTYVPVDIRGVQSSPEWIGFGNIVEMFTDPELWSAFTNNAIWIALGVPLPVIVGFLAALMVWGSSNRLSKIWQFALFLPYVIPQVAVGIAWSWLYHPRGGWFNRFLEFVGLGELARGWLGYPDTALYAVILASVWLQFGFVMILVLSSLQNVDLTLIEAARLDGAGWLSRIRNVIMPQIWPVLIMVTSVILVGAFNIFDLVFVMTGGGPAGASEVLGTYAYEAAFQLNRISYGTTVALLITALSIPGVLLLNRLQRRYL